MRPLRVLVTACGAPGTAALLRALRANGERQLALVGCDMRDEPVGRRRCDAFRRVPPGPSPLFVPAVLELCRHERIDVVLPQSSHDLAGLAGSRASFAAAGTTVLVADPEAVAVATDKAASYELLERLRVRVPRWRRVQGGRELARAASALGYPHRVVCIKRVRGSGSRGFRVLDPAVDPYRQLLSGEPGGPAIRLEQATEILPEVGGEELLVMEFVDGEERTIDGIAHGGRLVLGHPKTREAVRAGLAHSFRTLADDRLMDVARRVVAGFGLEHFFNVQMKGDAVIEVNPRISTIVYQEDVNIPYLGIKRALGELDDEELAAYAQRFRPTRRALRYYDQIEWDAEAADR